MMMQATHQRSAEAQEMSKWIRKKRIVPEPLKAKYEWKNMQNEEIFLKEKSGGLVIWT